MSAWYSMKEVIRLIRLTLLLRVAVALFGAVTTATLIPTTAPVLIELITVTPSVLLLVVTFLAPVWGLSSERFVKRLLVVIIIAETLEAVASRLGFQIYLASSGLDFGDLLRRSIVPPPEWAMLLRIPLNVPQLFISIPALLGAWISGRRGAGRWAIFAVVMTLLSTVTVISTEFPQWRLSLGVFGAQAMVVVLSCYFVASLADQQREEQKQLETANSELAAQSLVREQLAASRERVRLARDLHDTLAHTLASLVVQAKVVDTLLEKDHAAARRELTRMEAVARQGLEDARAAIGDLRANIVEDIGLSNALQRQVELLGQRASTQAVYEHCGEELQLDKNSAETMFRIVQEALNNVERHSRATHVTVNLEYGPPPEHAVTIRVKDDGVGFDLNALDDERFGLRGMRERAELIGAHLRIDSIVGTGTTVTVTFKKQV